MTPPPGPLACDFRREGGYGAMYKKGFMYINMLNVCLKPPQSNQQQVLNIVPIFRELKQQCPDEYIGSRSWAGFAAQQRHRRSHAARR